MGARIPVLNLKLGKAKVKATAKHLTVKGIRATLQKGAAQALNGYFSTSLFKGGLAVGKVPGERVGEGAAPLTPRRGRAVFPGPSARSPATRLRPGRRAGRASAASSDRARASKSRTAAEAATLSESARPSIGIETRVSPRPPLLGHAVALRADDHRGGPGARAPRAGTTSPRPGRRRTS